MEVEAPVRPGRPREFCTEAALAAALRVFWTKGYEAASLCDLTEAMGVTRPSLYAAFGNKESLFRRALELYGREKMAFMEQALAAPTARGVAERMLTQALGVQCAEGEPRGCLHVISSMAGGPEAASIKAELADKRAASERQLLARFERARAEGDLPPDAQPEALVRFLMTVMQGMAVQAGAGAPRATLQGVVDTTLALWPGR